MELLAAGDNTVKALRERKSWTQAELAYRLGITKRGEHMGAGTFHVIPRLYAVGQKEFIAGCLE